MLHRRVNLGEAVRSGTIANETLAYFIGRTHLFFLSIGMNPERVRFRQHLRHEMAHYAEDWCVVAGLSLHVSGLSGSETRV